MSSNSPSSTPQSHHDSHTLLAAPSSTTAAYGVLLTIFLYYLFRLSDLFDCLLQHSWNTLVYMTPSRLIAAFDTEYATDNENGHDQSRPSRHGQAEKGNALRRILRLDNGGIMQVFQSTRTLSNLRDMVQGRPMHALPGLGNWDNSCYQNSVLQGLASLASLPPFLASKNTETGESTRSALRDLASNLNDEDNIGRTLWTPAKLKNMSSWQQQDAQEYFSRLLDEVDKDVSQNKTQNLSDPYQASLAINESAPPFRSLSSARKRLETPSSKTSSILRDLPEELQANMFRSPLEGLLAQRVGCQRCGFVEGLSLVPFTCLTLPLGRDWLYDVRECLSEFTALESIEGVECVKCTLVQGERQMLEILETLQTPNQTPSPQAIALGDSVNQRLKMIRSALVDQDFTDNILKKGQIGPENRVSTTKSRQAVIARAPKALVLHINRSEFNELSGLQSKNYAKVQFPMHLSLDSWSLGALSKPSAPGIPVESWDTNPLTSMLAQKTYLEGSECYRLRAVITHYGRHENGHYICYRQSPSKSIDRLEKDTDAQQERSWWRLSDEDVTEVSQEEMLAQGGVFMLFYEQTKPAKTSPLLPMDGAQKVESSPVPTAPLALTVNQEKSVLPQLDMDNSRPVFASPTITGSASEDLRAESSRPRNSRLDSTDLENDGTAPTGTDNQIHETTKLSVEDDVGRGESDSSRNSSLDDDAAAKTELENTLLTPLATPEPAVSNIENPIPMLSPRSGRGSADQPAHAIEGIPGFVQAN